MKDDFEKCENCEVELPYEEMRYDMEGVPLCQDCFEECLKVGLWDTIEMNSFDDGNGFPAIDLDNLKDILIAYKIIEE